MIAPKFMRFRKLHRKQGFALVIVLWGVGLIAFLVLGFIVSTRLRVQSRSNLVEHAKASALAKAAVNVGIMSRLQAVMPANEPPVGGSIKSQTLLCSLPQPSWIVVDVEDESGKVDLNGASADLLNTLLRGLDVEQSRAETLTKAIVTFRSAPTSDVRQPLPKKGIEPKAALFQTKFELDQIEGMDEQLLNRLLPFVTVYSPRNGINPKAASPALLAILGDQTRSNSINPSETTIQIKPEFVSPEENSTAFTIHGEAALPNKTMAAQEALILLRPNGAAQGGDAFAIKEWNTTQMRYKSKLEAAIDSGELWPSCQKF